MEKLEKMRLAYEAAQEAYLVACSRVCEQRKTFEKFCTEYEEAKTKVNQAIILFRKESRNKKK